VYSRAVLEFDILRINGLEAAIVRVRCIARQMAVTVTENELLHCGAGYVANSTNQRRAANSSCYSFPGLESLFLLATHSRFGRRIELFLWTELAQQGYESYGALKWPGGGAFRPILKLTNG
jgi:hypothetical protein